MDLLREGLGRMQELAEEQRSIQAALEEAPPAPASRPSPRLVSDDPRPAPPPASPAGVEGPAPPSGARASDPLPARARAEGTPFPEDLHATLARRLAAIQEERQGRLRKILGAVMGKGTPGA